MLSIPIKNFKRHQVDSTGGTDLKEGKRGENQFQSVTTCQLFFIGIDIFSRGSVGKSIWNYHIFSLKKSFFIHLKLIKK